MSRRFLRQTVSLGVSYTLGTFNDNFFKQAILLLAVSMGHTAVQAWGTVLFSLPFVLFSAWAGWLADRYPKCRLVLAAKALEVCAMLAGGWGLLQLHWMVDGGFRFPSDIAPFHHGIQQPMHRALMQAGDLAELVNGHAILASAQQFQKVKRPVQGLYAPAPTVLFHVR